MSFKEALAAEEERSTIGFAAQTDLDPER